MLKHSKIILFLFLGLILTDCATLLNGTSQTLGLTSDPVGATVYVDGLEEGVTPMFVKLDRKNTHIIKFELLGYENSFQVINKSISLWVWANILFIDIYEIFIFIPLAVDYFMGGMYNLTPDYINVKLHKSGTTLLDNHENSLGSNK